MPEQVAGTAWAVYGLCMRPLAHHGRIGMLLAMGASICAAVIVYLVAAILTRAVTREDLSLIPGGEKISTFLHIR